MRKWTKERMDRFMATVAAKAAKRHKTAPAIVSTTVVNRRNYNHNHDELVHLTAELLRLLPDEKLIEMVKTQSR